MSEVIREVQEKRRAEIESALNAINEDIDRAKRNDVTLVAVSKTYPAADVALAASLGQIDFGENKVQELLAKAKELEEAQIGCEIRWHLIGHLQRNKVRQVIGKTFLIHSVDSLKLIREIGKRARMAELSQNILFEFNISGEKSKYGFAEDELSTAIAEAKKWPEINVSGLMTMAPAGLDEVGVRDVFARLRNLLNELQLAYPEAKTLSMGMSGDYEAALAEGSTMLRIGSKIFGNRVYY
ncbi:MAG: YggS family pyridoxal phosphate-dependent enzyme [Eubacteriales bacterium]|nr:YggS family pyridoxal phosphate-dependent enzyme [Eubacteriales bacterium]